MSGVTVVVRIGAFGMCDDDSRRLLEAMRNKSFSLSLSLSLASISIGAITSACGASDADAHPDATIAPAACPASWTAAPAVDATLVPQGAAPVLLHTHAVGLQSYKCEAATGTDGTTTYAWVFTGPTAVLTDCNGVVVGHHAAAGGPTVPQWSDVDGSTVFGSKVAAVTPDPASIAWLLLSAKDHVGDGVMSHVAFVQRVDTSGGIAPAASGCDATKVGAKADVGYGAEYYFLGAQGM